MSLSVFVSVAWTKESTSCQDKRVFLTVTETSTVRSLLIQSLRGIAADIVTAEVSEDRVAPFQISLLIVLQSNTQDQKANRFKAIIDLSPNEPWKLVGSSFSPWDILASQLKKKSVSLQRHRLLEVFKQTAVFALQLSSKSVRELYELDCASASELFTKKCGVAAFRFKNWLRIISCSPCYTAKFEAKLSITVQQSKIQQDNNYHRWIPMGPGPRRMIGFMQRASCWHNGKRQLLGSSSHSAGTLQMYDSLFKRTQQENLQMWCEFKHRLTRLSNPGY
jgi:hypothetical protein